MFVGEFKPKTNSPKEFILGVARTLVPLSKISLQDLSRHVDGADLGLDPQLASPESPPLIVIHTRVLHDGYLVLAYRVCDMVFAQMRLAKFHL
jgi:hypothetical protein